MFELTDYCRCLLYAISFIFITHLVSGRENFDICSSFRVRELNNMLGVLVIVQSGNAEEKCDIMCVRLVSVPVIVFIVLEYQLELNRSK